MTERINRIEEFLKGLIYNNIPLTTERILKEIKTCNIEPEQIRKVNGIHEELLARYKDKQKINVYKYKEQDPVCYLTNLFNGNERIEQIKKKINNLKIDEEKKTSPNKDPIKIYVSVDKDHLTKAATGIFDYLENENIEHISTVANEVKNDAITIKVFNQKDADSVINMINTNADINQGKLPQNPFMINIGNACLAQDNYNSYNVVLATFIKYYLIACKRRNTISRINIQDFYAFVKNCDASSKEFVISARKTNKINYEQDVYFIQEIKNLILLSLQSNNKEDFYKHFESVKGNRTEEQNTMTPEEIIIKLKKAYEYTKYNLGQTAAENALIYFLNTGNAAGITRTTPYGEILRVDLKNAGYTRCKEELKKYTKSNNVIDAVIRLEALNIEALEKNNKKRR